MGTHPIFESDFDCLTELACVKCRRHFSLATSPRIRDAPILSIFWRNPNMVEENTRAFERVVALALSIFTRPAMPMILFGIWRVNGCLISVFASKSPIHCVHAVAVVAIVALVPVPVVADVVDPIAPNTVSKSTIYRAGSTGWI